jgi:chromosome segregation ATPase
MMTDASKPSETPRTDAIAQQHDTTYKGHEIGAIYALSRQLERELVAAQARLNDLMAVIHGDGGHHREEVGDEQCLHDATQAVLERRLRLTKLEHVVKEWPDKMHALMDDLEMTRKERDAARNDLANCELDRDALRAERDALKAKLVAMTHHAAHLLTMCTFNDGSRKDTLIDEHCDKCIAAKTAIDAARK